MGSTKQAATDETWRTLGCGVPARSDRHVEYRCPLAGRARRRCPAGSQLSTRTLRGPRTRRSSGTLTSSVSIPRPRFSHETRRRARRTRARLPASARRSRVTTPTPPAPERASPDPVLNRIRSAPSWRARRSNYGPARRALRPGVGAFDGRVFTAASVASAPVLPNVTTYSVPSTALQVPTTVQRVGPIRNGRLPGR